MHEAKKKTLLVDDSRTSLFMERMILRQGPYELVIANDGVEGVEQAKAESPGCSEYVSKPINSEEPLAKVRSCLAG